MSMFIESVIISNQTEKVVVPDDELSYIGKGRWLAPDGQIVYKNRNKSTRVGLSMRVKALCSKVSKIPNFNDMSDEEFDTYLQTREVPSNDVKDVGYSRDYKQYKNTPINIKDMSDEEFDAYLDYSYGVGKNNFYGGFWDNPARNTDEYRMNFAPVVPGDTHIYGSSSPHKEKDFSKWYTFMKSQGITKVLVLLNQDDLIKIEKESGFNVLEQHKKEFGADNIMWVPVKDFSYMPRDDFFNKVYPFLENAVVNDEKVVVHCSAGIGRTGHVLLAWLVHHEGMSAEEAKEVLWSGDATRNPNEAGGGESLAELLRKGSIHLGFR